WENDRNRLGRVLDRESGRCRGDDEHVEVESNELIRKFGKSLRAALRVPTLHDEVSSLYISKFLEVLKEDVFDLQVRNRDQAHPPDLARLLRLGDERLNEEAQGKRRADRSANARHAPTDVLPNDPHPPPTFCPTLFH